MAHVRVGRRWKPTCRKISGGKLSWMAQAEGMPSRAARSTPQKHAAVFASSVFAPLSATIVASLLM